MANFQQAIDTAANWKSNNRTPLLDEWCVESDTGLAKMGDGATAYNSLVYMQTAGLFGARGHSGNYYGAQMYDGNPNYGRSPGRMDLTPFLVARAFTAVALVIDVTASGASTFCRLGIYASAADGYPSAVVVDAGQVSASTTGIKSATISTVLVPGLYWLASAVQGSNGITCMCSGGTPSSQQLVGLDSITSTSDHAGVYVNSGVTGALPSSPAISGIDAVTYVMVQAA